jgi:predicted GIY-YIG superfamily endonuclease
MTIQPDAGTTPLERYLADMDAERTPRRPNTHKNMCRGAMCTADVPNLEFVIFDVLVAGTRKWDVWKLSEKLHVSDKVVRRTLAHLVEHGWLVASKPPWETKPGLDCTCPGRRWRGRTQDRRPPPDGIENNGRTALYRLYDAEDRLLYVGITDVLAARMRQHAKEQQWWPEVARQTVAWYDERAKADLAETLAVAAEKPLHNKAKLYSPAPAADFEWMRQISVTCIGCDARARRGCRTCWEHAELELRTA